MGKFLRIMSILMCLGMVTALSGCASSPKTETAGQYLDDTVVTSRVKAAIFKEPNLKTLQINVETYQGIVQLSGFVDTMDSARRAGEVAKNVEGVKEVKNDLVVK